MIDTLLPFGTKRTKPIFSPKIDWTQNSFRAIWRRNDSLETSATQFMFSSSPYNSLELVAGTLFIQWLFASLVTGPAPVGWSVLARRSPKNEAIRSNSVALNTMFSYFEMPPIEFALLRGCCESTRIFIVVMSHSVLSLAASCDVRVA